MADSLALAPRKAIFVAEFLKDGNGTQAAIRAGYAAGSAHVAASRLLRDDKVQSEIAKGRAEIAKKDEITHEWLRERYRMLATADIRKCFNEDGTLKAITELDDAEAAALAGCDVEEVKITGGEEGESLIEARVKKIKRWDPTKALDALAKHTGFFPARDTKNSININLSLEAMVAASYKIGEGD